VKLLQPGQQSVLVEGQQTLLQQSRPAGQHWLPQHVSPGWQQVPAHSLRLGGQTQVWLTQVFGGVHETPHVPQSALVVSVEQLAGVVPLGGQQTAFGWQATLHAPQ
jgi:hypothetical protein